MQITRRKVASWWGSLLKKVGFFLLVTSEFFLGFLACETFSSPPLNRLATRRAWAEWRRNPSPVTEAAWIAERRRHRIAQATIDGTIYLLLALNTAGLVIVCKRICKS